jgi:Ricin-type beta-trefoil lectin domain
MVHRHRVPRWLVSCCGVAVLIMSTGSLLTPTAVAAGGEGIIADLNTDLCLQATSAGKVSTQGCDGRNRQNWHYDIRTTWLVDAQTGGCLTAYRDGTVATRSCRQNVTRQEWDSYCFNSIVQWTSVAFGKNLASFKNGWSTCNLLATGTFKSGSWGQALGVPRRAEKDNAEIVIV